VADINLDEAALEFLLNSPDGPVGELLAEMAGKATEIAKAAAPVMSPATMSWGRNSTSYGPPGFTKERTRSHMGYTKGGTLFSGVNAPYGPTLFLERPARQLHYPRLFLSTALWTVEL
jgi:hypothetical protein